MLTSESAVWEWDKRFMLDSAFYEERLDTGVNSTHSGTRDAKDGPGAIVVLPLRDPRLEYLGKAGAVRGREDGPSGVGRARFP